MASLARIRILSLFFHPRSHVTAVGGAEKRFIEVLRLLLERGNLEISVVESTPSLLTSFRDRLREVKPLSGFNLFVGSYGWFSIYFEWILWMVKAFASCFNIAYHRKYDLILASNNNIPNILLSYIVSRLTRTPLCVIVHHLEGLIGDEVGIIKTYYTCRYKGFGRLFSLVRVLALLTITMILRNVEACISVSASIARILAKLGVPERIIYVSGNGINLEYIDSFVALSEEKIYDAVFVGRISREKGVYNLLNVWLKIAGFRSASRLIMIGSGPEINDVKKSMSKLGLNKNVILRGPCPDSQMYAIMKASKLFVLPSIFEGWGLAVAEALACGLPVVCYDIPSLREVFGRCKSVFFVPVNDLEALRSTILSLLKRTDFNDLAEEARSYVERFSWEAVAEKDLEIIKNILGSVDSEVAWQ
ncbi:TPA: glycosyltransferase family 1 protein [Candidatus Bathyarchaeota archaeon]|nr:glycosyltransferase family 1 protein [Candidatus Bathyarchaeota archaeon]